MVMFFENEKRQGGGNVNNVIIDREKRSAVVEFEEGKALDKVLQKRPIVIMGTEINVEVFDDKCPKTTQNTRIVVSGLPRDMSVEFLALFFENEKRFGGGPVKNVVIDEGTNSATVEFEEPKAVTNVLQKRPVIVQGTEVQISTSVKEPERSESTNETQLKVSGLPENISKEYLIMFFENEQRQGGGNVKSVEVNEDKHTAIIAFEEEKAVETVLQKRPIVIKNNEVVVNAICKDITAMPKECSKIKVSCLPLDVTEEYLIMFFENERRYGGGHVKHTEIDQINHTAVIEFEAQAAVYRVLEKRPIVLLGQKVTVDIFDEVKEPTMMLVGELPDDATDDFLVMFFENERRQGGGKVKTVEINFSKSHAIIEFDTSDSLKKVLEKRPILISGKKCEISVFNGSDTIEVRGVDKSTEKQLLQYFENTSLSGGETVQYIRVDKDKRVTFVSFLRPEVVKRVCERRNHNLNQRALIVNTYISTSKSDEFKQPSEKEIIYSRDQAQGSLNSFSDENTQIQSERKLTEDKLQEHDGPDTTDCLRLKQVLEKLGLADKYPSKISIRDVIAVDPEEANDQEKQVHLSDIPKIILRRLISAHSDARDITTTNGTHIGNENDFAGTVSFLSAVPDESEDLSPIDIFSVVFQCCDPFMKQVFFQKLYLCKMAVPFLYQSWATEVKTPVVSVWPLRYLAIENKMKSSVSQFSSKEVDMLELSSKVLAFARFGRPRCSKSKFLNSLLSSNGCKTFFNIDCPSGMTPRYISNGQIEMFWLPTIGDKNDKFQDAVTFLNMRGDLNKHYASNVCDFTAKLADAVAIVIDLYSIRKEKDVIKHYLIQFASVILIIANPLNQEDVLIVQDFERNVKASRNDISLRVLSTHRGTIEQNVVDMVSMLSKHIISQLKSSTCRSLQQRLSEALKDSVSVRTDEEEADCQYGKNEAETLMKRMKMDGEPRVWKQVLTPVHCKYSKELGQLKKKREREKGLAEGENIERKMRDIRKIQTKSITNTVKYFINILTNDPESCIKLKLVLGWLHFFIEREKRKILPQLMYKNRRAWEQLEALKSSKETEAADDVEKQENLITDLEGAIDDASFSVEHFFREIGHIYEAVLELEINASDVGLPEIDKIAYVVGRLVADGHQLQLIDGESFYMPFRWTQKVLQHVNEVIKSGKVMTLSVLGVQSSGKSTLLNTMFGSQFSTRTGRCTRGIHVQLVPAITGKYSSAATPFDYVLVVDTEGLLPELSHIQHEHDNELATVITGLGDITMLNIMGENTSEIRDILQVIVHAFLRLKMTNRNLDIRKSCTLIHQNVTDTSASENRICVLRKIMQTLDAMTEESAKSEGILDITTFNQVIEFDINTQVWYLKSLWQGNPPMARVNTEYSERVVDMKCRILQKALNMENKSYKSITDILEQAHNLWKGVLNEDFVFSFRNSLEIRAYMEMEKFVQNHLWQLESFIREKLIEKSQSKFSDCDQKDKLRNIADDIITDLKDLLSDEKIRKEKDIITYFEVDKYKDIIIQWKTTQQCRLDTLCSKLERTIKDQVERICIKRSVEILTVSSHKKHEEELRIKSMEVANRYKGTKLTQAQKDELFAEIWNSFINKVDTNGSSTDAKRKSMKIIFIDCLKHLFQKNSAVLKASLQTSLQLTPLQNLDKLAGSFGKTGVDENDISLSVLQNVRILFKMTDVMAHINTRVNQIFTNFDEKIKQICQVNDEITEMNVNELFHDLHKSIHDILTDKRKYDFKPTFKVKIYIHVSRYAHPIFEKHNEDYFKTQGVAVRLEQYKEQQKIRFEAYLSNRALEDIVAHQQCH
ncbi:interferon-induced very large GTPase 1-like [Mercenaria mercenaria]|uniref:interferon-induced very large GTPase 1-like n=1 Tax=Mercenaria mercenaria TaxID=6596 RepID=UPI00234F858B|nr:interferon-induced very large GTPase 1-like [Mercenaria mercenaria]